MQKRIFIYGLVIFSLLILDRIHAQNYLLTGGKYYDSKSESFVQGKQILIEDGKILDIAEQIDVQDGFAEINCEGKTIIPGLIDMHTHLFLSQRLEDNLVIDALLQSDEQRILRAAFMAESYLKNGFTTVRDVGNSGQYLDVYLQQAIRAGYVSGPNLLVSGPIISPIGGQFYQLPFDVSAEMVNEEYDVISSIEEARLVVREHINRRVDVIKILSNGERLNLSIEEMQAIVEEAKKYGLTVTAHATDDQAIWNAVSAGVSGIEHGYYVADSTLEFMAEKGVYLVPTDPSVNRIIQQYKQLGKEDYTENSIKKEIAVLPDRLKRAIDKGVEIVAGSDAYFNLDMPRGEDAKDMLVAYHQSGLSIPQVLNTATLNPAKVLGREDQIGIIQKNATADLVVLDGDLEANFEEVIYLVGMVLKSGKIVEN